MHGHHRNARRVLCPLRSELVAGYYAAGCWKPHCEYLHSHPQSGSGSCSPTTAIFGQFCWWADGGLGRSSLRCLSFNESQTGARWRATLLSPGVPMSSKLGAKGNRRVTFLVGAPWARLVGVGRALASLGLSPPHIHIETRSRIRNFPRSLFPALVRPFPPPSDLSSLFLRSLFYLFHTISYLRSSPPVRIRVCNFVHRVGLHACHDQRPLIRRESRNGRWNVWVGGPSR